MIRFGATNLTPEDRVIMFRQIIRFFGRIFRSKGLRTAAKVIFWMFAGYFLFNYFYAVTYFMRMEGMSFHKASAFILDVLLQPFSRTFVSVILGAVIGIMGYYRGRKKKADAEAEEKPAEKTEPEPAQEEEIIETKHYTFR